MPMPKYLKEKERLNFRKMISEPKVLKSIGILSEKFNEDMYKSAYRLMKMGSEIVCKNNLEQKKATKIT